MRGRSKLLVARSLWAAFCLSMLGVGLSAAAGADGGATQLQVRSVDAGAKQLAVDVIATDAPRPAALSVTLDGKKVKPTSVTKLSETELSSVAVVVDNAKSLGNAPVQFAKQALTAVVPGGAIDQVAVVSAGGLPAVLAGPTRSGSTVRSGLGDLGPSDHPSVIWDAAAEGAERLGAIDGTQRNLVLVVGSPDTGSATTVARLDDLLRNDEITVHVIAMPGGHPDLAQLRSLVARRGGTFQTGSSADLTAMVSKVVTTIGSQYRVVLPGGSAAEALRTVNLSWGGATADASFRNGQVTTGLEDLRPAIVDQGFLEGALDNTLVKWLVIALGTASVGVIAYVAFSLTVRNKDGLDFTLRHYDGYSEDEVLADEGGLATSDFLKKAVSITGSVAERQGFLVRVEDLLEQADLPLRPAEALFFYVAIAIVVVIAAVVVAQSTMMALIAAILALILPKYVVGFMAKLRMKKFVAQLPDMLQLLSGTLRAGYSISQGFEAVSKEVEDPMGKELQRVMTEARLGRPLEDALDASAQRMGSDDFTWAVMAVRIQREVGGNLAELLLTVADTMTQRERLRRDISALTAEGRMSAIIIGMLPPGLALVMYTMNPGYIGRLFQDGVGIGLIVIATIAMFIGFAWMKKVITIEI